MGGRRSSPRSLPRWLSLVSLAVIAALGLSACAGSGYSYVKSSSTRTYFKVPDDWKLYSREDVVNNERRDALTPALKEQYPFLVVFDGSPNPSVQHDLSTATSPWGLARVRRLSASERDKFSLQVLRNEVIPIDQLANQDNAIELVAEPKAIQLQHGGRGARLVFRVNPPDSEPFSAVQIGMVDASTKTVWFLIIGCQVKCFNEHRRQIDEIADSWTVKEK